MGERHIVAEPTVVIRKTASGIEVHCFQMDITDVVTVDCMLRDSLGREEEVTIGRSTVMVLVPIGALGALPYEPIGETDEKNRPIFRQRILLANHDVHRQVYNTLEEIAKKNGLEQRVALAGGARPRRM